MDWVSDSSSDDLGWLSDNEVKEESEPANGLINNNKVLEGSDGASSSSGSSSLTRHFVAMGFPQNLVTKAIKENGGGDSEAILELLLTYSAIEPASHKEGSSSDEFDNWDATENFSEPDDSDDKDFEEELFGHDNKLKTLIGMGFTRAEASSAIDRCGQDAPVAELADSIYAAQTAEKEGGFGEYEHLSDDEARARRDRYNPFSPNNKRKQIVSSGERSCTNNFHRKRSRQSGGGDARDRLRREFSQSNGATSSPSDDTLILPNPMIGFGLPTDRTQRSNRRLPDSVVGPPYFYYENVALAPKGVWQTISRFLYDIEPEFVDSKFFCAAARKRGYVHNLPLENRFPLLPMPPKTILEAFPQYRPWWPSWDHRQQLNCLQTCIASAKLTERIRVQLETYAPDAPPPRVQKYILDECRKWNLIWAGLNKVAPLEPDEIEFLLGFPRNHTRGISRTDRYKSLGNSFQVDTVAYHLSVLKDMFPNGMKMLSLFSGIGGAEVALHRLGIHMKLVVSVEISEINRNILKSWWEQTGQTGQLIEIADVTKVDPGRIESLVRSYGGFDLVIGGSPCNNLAGSNRHHRDGLEGIHSALFYDYFRILDTVRNAMGRN